MQLNQNTLKGFVFCAKEFNKGLATLRLDLCHL